MAQPASKISSRRRICLLALRRWAPAHQLTDATHLWRKPRVQITVGIAAFLAVSSGRLRRDLPERERLRPTEANAAVTACDGDARSSTARASIGTPYASKKLETAELVEAAEPFTTTIHPLVETKGCLRADLAPASHNRLKDFAMVIADKGQDADRDFRRQFSAPDLDESALL
jgi:hypothetical protein